MTNERKDELYAALVREAEARTATGYTVTRFEMLKIMDEQHGIKLNRESLDLVEKLYADGFVKA